MLKRPAPSPMMMRNCCLQQCGYQLNPLDVKNTLASGTVCEACKSPYGEEALAAAEEEPPCILAMANIADQLYVAGYCPREALVQGTMFPELVRPYAH